MHIRAQLKDLMCLPDRHMLKYQEGAHVFVSESALYRAPLEDLMCPPDGHMLQYQEGAQVFISDTIERI